MYKLTNSFPYILNRVGVRMGDLFATRLAADDLSLNMYRTLAALWERDGQKLTELSEFTSVEPSTLSRMIGTLKRRGLVLRQRRERNGRTVQIGLTPQGRALVEQYIPFAELYEKLALQGFGAQDISKIKKNLHKIYQNLDIIEQTLAAKPASTRSKVP